MTEVHERPASGRRRFAAPLLVAGVGCAALGLALRAMSSAGQAPEDSPPAAIPPTASAGEPAFEELGAAPSPPARSAPAAQRDEAPADDPLARSEEPGEDWPSFLGARRDGTSRETELLAEWPAEGPPLLWAKPIGEGYGAPSVQGQRLVLHHRQGREEVVECFHALTGESLWTVKYPSRFRDPYGYNNGPRCSPVLTPTHCFTFGAEGVLLCVRLRDGREVWRVNTQQDFRIPEGFFGVGATPILDGERLIVLVGGQPDSGVVAFQASSGKVLWESVGKSTWDGCETGWPQDPRCQWTGEEMVVSYSSPVLADVHGHRHLLCLMRQGLVSLNPADGEERFHYWFRSRVHESVNAACPVVIGDDVLISAEYRTGAARLKLLPDGRSFEVVWRTPRGLETHWSTAVHLDGSVYGFSGHYEPEGRLTCIDAATGEVRWESPGWDAPLDDFARASEDDVINRRTNEPALYPVFGRGSLTYVDGRLLALGERGGLLALVQPSADGYQELARARVPHIGYPSWAAPVVSRGRVYLRSQEWLVCLDLRRPRDP